MKKSSYLKISGNATADISNQITQHWTQTHLQKSPNWVLYLIYVIHHKEYIEKPIHSVMTTKTSET